MYILDCGIHYTMPLIYIVLTRQIILKFIKQKTISNEILQSWQARPLAPIGFHESLYKMGII